MSNKTAVEREIVVRKDAHGNVVEYDIVEKGNESVKSEPLKRAKPRRLRRKRRISKMILSETDQQIQDEIDYERIPIVPDSPKSVRQYSLKVVHTRPKSKVKIFQQKLQWNAEPKVDTHNEYALDRNHANTEVKIIDQPMFFYANAKVDTRNEFALYRKQPEEKFQMFSAKPIWNAEPKVDSHNELIVDYQHRTQKQYVHHEKLNWNAASTKIDTHNEDAIEMIKTAPKTEIYHKKFFWKAPIRIDSKNFEYLKEKQRNDALREEKSKIRAQSFPQDRIIRVDEPRIDHYNAEYLEERKRRKHIKLPPIEDQKLEWEKKSRVNQRNDDYIERKRQQRIVPQIFRQKLNWEPNNRTRINDHNEDYLNNMKERPRPRIVNQLPRWYSHKRVDTYNDEYNQRPTTRLRPIVNEKLQWKAQSKIDTNIT